MATPAIIKECSSEAFYDSPYPGDEAARHIPVRNWWYNEPWTWKRERYFKMLHRCAEVGNLDACFLLGMETVYGFENYKSGMDYLNKASSGGHHAAAYAMGILLFGEPKTRNHGMELLNQAFSCSDIKRCRTEVVSIVRDICWRWRAANASRCSNPKCVEPENDWARQSFCGLLCRLRYECDRRRCGSVQRRTSCGNPACRGGENGSAGRRFCGQVCRWREDYLEFHKMI